jgi:hypothetical protein
MAHSGINSDEVLIKNNTWYCFMYVVCHEPVQMHPLLLETLYVCLCATVLFWPMFCVLSSCIASSVVHGQVALEGTHLATRLWNW